MFLESLKERQPLEITFDVTVFVKTMEAYFLRKFI